MFTILQRYYSPGELNSKVGQLRELCLRDKNQTEHQPSRKEGLIVLEEIIHHLNPIHTRSYHLKIIIWSSITCIQHFFVNSQYVWNCLGCRMYKRHSCYYKRSLRAYQKVIHIFMNIRSESIFNTVVAYLIEAKLWKIESLCYKLLQVLSSNEKNGHKCVNYLFTVVEEYVMVKDVYSARMVMRILYNLLQSIDKIATEFIKKFLNLMKICIGNLKNDTYVQLYSVLEVCIRRIIEKISNSDLLIVIRIMVIWSIKEPIENHFLLRYGNIVEYAAKIHNAILYVHSFSSDLMTSLLKLIESKNRLKSLLGNRVLQHLLDRQNNRCFFETPQLFTKDSNYNITIHECDISDRLFMEYYREKLHVALMSAIALHGINRMNLESIYTTMALLSIEIPTGYTAAAIVCLSMNIQQDTLNKENKINHASAHRLHATVISILSLICWVHRAHVFYSYVDTIVTRRSKVAPHLNPPLKSIYQYQQHHVVWNKKELFLESWEVRYGLWKCFRSIHQ